MPDQLVDAPDHHHYAKLRGQGANGEMREVTVDLDQLEKVVPHDSEIFQNGNHNFRGNGQQDLSNISREGVRNTNHNIRHHNHHHGHRSDSHIGHHATHDQHFEDHEHAEHLRGWNANEHEHDSHHEHKLKHRHEHKEKKEHHHKHHEKKHDKKHDKKHEEKTKPAPTPTTKKSSDKKQKEHHEKKMYSLPTGLAEHYNETLFDELHGAPFDIYQAAMGHEIDDDESFPVFSVPSWHSVPGLFSAFSKHAEPLVFENSQFLLKWEDIQGASTVSSDTLQEFIADFNFHSNLVIAKSFKEHKKTVAFLGLVVSYYQYGAQKNVLVPFGRLEDFFDDASEQHLADPETRHLEAEALQEMLDNKQTNSSDFYHPALAHSQERKDQLEDLEIIHFQKLYQLLIRRSFLFSYGYADCLLTEPEHLRECLDDTFYSLVKMETSVRGALDEQMVEQLADINDTFHERIKDVCISFQGGIMGTGSCNSKNDITSFVTSFASM